MSINTVPQKVGLPLIYFISLKAFDGPNGSIKRHEMVKIGQNFVGSNQKTLVPIFYIQAGPSMMWYFYACCTGSMRRFLKSLAWLAQHDIAKEGQHACTI